MSGRISSRLVEIQQADRVETRHRACRRHGGGYIHIYVYVYIYMYVYIYICEGIGTQHAHMYIYIYMCVYLLVHVLDVRYRCVYCVYGLCLPALSQCLRVFTNPSRRSSGSASWRAIRNRSHRLRKLSLVNAVNIQFLGKGCRGQGRGTTQVQQAFV